VEHIVNQSKAQAGGTLLQTVDQEHAAEVANMNQARSKFGVQ